MTMKVLLTTAVRWEESVSEETLSVLAIKEALKTAFTTFLDVKNSIQSSPCLADIYRIIESQNHFSRKTLLRSLSVTINLALSSAPLKPCP